MYNKICIDISVVKLPVSYRPLPTVLVMGPDIKGAGVVIRTKYLCNNISQYI